MCDTSEGGHNLLSSALPDIPSDRGSALGGTRLSDGLCRPEGIAFKRRAVDAGLRHKAVAPPRRAPARPQSLTGGQSWATSPGRLHFCSHRRLFIIK